MPGKPISPDDQRGFNHRLMATLEELGVVYAIGGSVAAMMYSQPRLTIDVDVMVSAPLRQLSQLVQAVQSWQVYITPLENIIETNLPYGLPFNIIDGTIGTKADLYIAKNTGLDASAMARRRRLVWDRETGAEAWFLSPEDVILYKLSYYRQGGEVAQKHPTDIANMLGLIGSKLDLAYLTHWATEIGVADLWQALWDEFQQIVAKFVRSASDSCHSLPHHLGTRPARLRRHAADEVCRHSHSASLLGLRDPQWGGAVQCSDALRSFAARPQPEQEGIMRNYPALFMDQRLDDHVHRARWIFHR